MISTPASTILKGSSLNVSAENADQNGMLIAGGGGGGGGAAAGGGAAEAKEEKKEEEPEEEEDEVSPESKPYTLGCTAVLEPVLGSEKEWSQHHTSLL